MIDRDCAGRLSSAGRPWPLLALLLLTACSSFPQRPAYEESVALPAAPHGELNALWRELGSRLDARESAHWLIEESAEALDVRLALFDEAVSSLDIQYFIWEPDATGRLLFHRLILAADRGVKVRLLMDDITTTRRDHEFLSLDEHANIEVRYFNPWTLRSRIGRVVEFMFRFGALNHRLHNKTIIADGRLGLIGGRNMGDRYFGLYEVFVQNDLDILFAGPIVERVSEDFDLYWNSGHAYKVADFLEKRRERSSLAALRVDLEEYIGERQEHLQSFPVIPVAWDDLLDRLADTYAGGATEYLYDLPHVGETLPTQLYDQFRSMIERAEEELVISTAYLIPDAEFVEQLCRMAARGVRIVISTNSLQTNNHTLAHAAYKRWRERLVEAGVELYELRPDAAILDDYVVEPVESGFLGLHSKAVIVDGRLAFVGTPNIDPRAMIINTENGLAVDSEKLAQELRALVFEATRPENAWRIELDERGRVIWVGLEGVRKRQPANGFGQRLKEFFIGLLPLKKQA